MYSKNAGTNYFLLTLLENSFVACIKPMRGDRKYNQFITYLQFRFANVHRAQWPCHVHPGHRCPHPRQIRLVTTRAAWEPHAMFHANHRTPQVVD